MIKRIDLHDDIVFTGGCAKNTYLQGLFENRFRTKIHVHENPDMLAALGAALYAGREEHGFGAPPGLQNQRDGKKQRAVVGSIPTTSLQ